jgi:glycosyltransferase involved in cell wall biosynthesis
MILGIDASNIRVGGGVTHLVELLKEADPSKYGFTKVILWSGSKTLNQIEERDWLEKQYLPVFDKSLLERMFWQLFKLSKLVKGNGCILLFAPGGSYAGDFHPMVTMSRNLLPFEWKELLRYGMSLKLFKMIILRFIQSHSFQVADGLIFLTAYSKEAVNEVTIIPDHKTTIIPHGISNQFVIKPRPHLKIENYSKENPFRIIYVSVIEMYKHQWNVAEAVYNLHRDGIPVVLDLIGSSYPPALKKLQKKLKEIDPDRKIIRYLGAVPYKELHMNYDCSDLFLFASSCENMPNILLEGMASGLPIACSKLGPMPEILGEAGVYFDPLDVSSIKDVIKKLIDSQTLRNELANRAFQRARFFSWKICADKTFEYFKTIIDLKLS